MREEAKRKFMDFLEKKNLRITDQRRVIIDTVFSTEEHFTPEQLLEWAREKDRSSPAQRSIAHCHSSPRGSRARDGLGKPYKFYDPNYSDHPNHNHLICEDCEKIVEFDSDQIESIENEIGQIRIHREVQKLQLSATCDVLKKSGAWTKRASN
ncbi:MAG: hypothetical protein CM1200mP29_03440 [Verrucomicrobiota bacterium]|nr:MAG: hypothetical protein CM1200mP29_03440 [Verrucomicrobiota bacterium]